jgi:superfamily II DNA or RNA helicase
MASQTQKKGKSVWFIVHRQELMDQTIDTFSRFGISMVNIFVGMVSTAANHPERLPDPDLIILDECHHAAAATWQKIILRFPDTYTIGLTATPCRLDGKPLGAIFTDMVKGVTTTDLIDQGFLSRYRYFAPSVADLSGLKRKGSDFDQEQAAELLMKKAVYGDVLHHWRQYANNLQTIVYCSSIKHSQAIAEAFQADGINAVHFDGNTPKQERQQIISDFRNSTIRILCNVDLISEGFDLPDCQCCVLLRPTASLGLFIQQTGRALRPLPGKIAIILDHVGNYARHGLPDDQREWSLSERIQSRPEYRDDGRLNVRMCRECFFTYPTGPDVCPNCGAPVISTREEIKNIRNIQLAEIQQGRRERAAEAVQGKSLNECRNLQEVMAWCKQNGKKSGFGYLHAKRKGMVR